MPLSVLLVALWDLDDHGGTNTMNGAPTEWFSAISIDDWRQFHRVDIAFDRRLTVLTGRNGTGKSTILNMLAKHGPYSTPLVGSPRQLRDPHGRYLSSKAEDLVERNRKIGAIHYSGGLSSVINVNEASVETVDLRMPNQQNVSVLNIGSHRKLPKYKAVDTIPTRPVSSANALSAYQTDFWADYTRTPPLARMKESLVSMAVFGMGNEIVSANEESYSIFSEFQNRLRQLIPSNIGFQRLSVNVPDVIVETRSGNFLIDASSGGLMSLIDIAWEITLFARSNRNPVIIIDEPENHLHPSMQREFLPALVDAFDDAQFVIATHSPFMVNSVRDARVYAFDVVAPDEPNVADDLSGARNAVVTIPVSLADRTSADEVMRKVLGVPVTVPIWAEKTLEAVAREFGGEGLSKEVVGRIRAALQAQGLEEYLPQAVAEAAARHAEAN